MKTFAIAIIALAFASGAAEAACHATFIDGRPGQLCDNAMDLPSLAMPGLAPLVPPSITPLEMPGIPPIGTSSCRQAQVWNGSVYVWRSICS